MPGPYLNMNSDNDKSIDEQLADLGYIVKPKQKPQSVWSSDAAHTYITNTSNTSNNSVSTISWNNSLGSSSGGFGCLVPLHEWNETTAKCENLSKMNEELEQKIKKLQDQVKTQSHNYDELQKSYEDLMEAHKALRVAIVETSPDIDNLVDGYRNAIEDLKRIIDSRNKSIKHLEDHIIAAEHSREHHAQIWNALSLAQKVEKLNGGMDVWSASSGEGPLRTIVETRTEITKNEGTFGVWCLDSRGRRSKYFVADLVPYKPETKISPSKLNLLITTLAGTAGASYLAFQSFGAKGVAVAGLVQTVLMLLQLREYSKAR